MAVALIYFQVKNALDFISNQDDLNKTFKDIIKSLTERLDKLGTSVENVKGMLLICCSVICLTG